MLLRNRLRFDASFDQGPLTGYLSLDVKNDRLNLGIESEITLREAYVDLYFNRADFRIGKQQVVWGKADGLFINDIVCPLNMRMFLLQDFDNIRMALSMVKANLYLGEWTLEGLWISEFEPWKFAEPGSDWAFQLGPPDTIWTVIPSPPESYMVPNIIHMGEPSLPKTSLKNSEVGAKISSFILGTDITILLLDGFNDHPVAQLDSFVAGIEKIDSYFTPFYYRSRMYGLNFSRSIFSMVVRGEVGYYSDRCFPDFDAELRYSVSDFFQGMIGLDMTGPFNIGISVQGIRQQIMDYQSSMEDDEVGLMASILVRGSFWRESATAMVLGILDLSDMELKSQDFGGTAGLVRFLFDYRWVDGLTFTLGTDMMWGRNNSIFGQFENNDNLFFKVKYHF